MNRSSFEDQEGSFFSSGSVDSHRDSRTRESHNSWIPDHAGRQREPEYNRPREVYFERERSTRSSRRDSYGSPSSSRRTSDPFSSSLGPRSSGTSYDTDLVEPDDDTYTQISRRDSNRRWNADQHSSDYAHGCSDGGLAMSGSPRGERYQHGLARGLRDDDWGEGGLGDQMTYRPHALPITHRSKDGRGDRGTHHMYTSSISHQEDGSPGDRGTYHPQGVREELRPDLEEPLVRYTT